ncbi:MAG: hypothetical protein KGL39_30970 [Patescibacteria group bacterium]|nr:hypothetical protein [Patescibacteria group bacterium]
MADKKKAKQLQEQTAAVRVSFHWIGTRRALTSEQKGLAAEPFAADKAFLNASQKLLDTRHPKMLALTRIKGDVLGHWRGHTLPYVEDGVRLIPKDQIESFNAKMQEFHGQFGEAVAELGKSFAELKEAAKEKLGDLYSDANYPKDPSAEFGFEWSFPSVEPPAYLKTLNPSLYAQAKQQIEAKFNEAVGMAQQALTSEFAALVADLHERLTPGPDGAKKVFRDSTVDNLKTFFERFKALNVTGNADLEHLVADAQKLLAGGGAKELRTDAALKAEVAAGMAQVKEKLAPLVQVAPRRKITPIGGANGNGKAHADAPPAAEKATPEPVPA